MKRVICLYRVSTIGQVDHDDIPMQKLACREYVASHTDWELVNEIADEETVIHFLGLKPRFFLFWHHPKVPDKDAIRKKE